MSKTPSFSPLRSLILRAATFPTPFIAVLQDSKGKGTTPLLYLGIASSCEDLDRQVTASFGQARTKDAQAALNFESQEIAA